MSQDIVMITSVLTPVVMLFVSAACLFLVFPRSTSFRARMHNSRRAFACGVVLAGIVFLAVPDVGSLLYVVVEYITGSLAIKYYLPSFIYSFIVATIVISETLESWNVPTSESES